MSHSVRRSRRRLAQRTNRELKRLKEAVVRMINMIAPPTESQPRANHLEKQMVLSDPLEEEFVEGVIMAFNEYFTRTELSIEETKTKINESIMVIEELLAAPKKTDATMRRVGELRSAIKGFEGALRNLFAKKDEVTFPAEARLREQYREIMAIPRVAHVTAVNGRIVYRTEPLFGKDHRSRWRRIGRFKNSFDAIHPQLTSIRWTNLDGPREKRGEVAVYHGPPNISGTVVNGYGTVGCAGPMAIQLVATAALALDYTTLVGFSVRYAECAGSSIRDTIELWPLVRCHEVPVWYRRQFS